MKKLYHIIAIIVILLTHMHLCVYANNDLTSNNFTVDLGAMDPMGGGSSPAGGVGAIKSLLTKISEILLFMIPIIAAVAFIVAGYFFIFSSGDSERVNKAKMIIKWNIIALVVAFLSYAIVRIVATFFSS